jgi:hypothetical protein
VHTHGKDSKQMSRDELTAAFDEWRADAMKDLNRVPNRFEAFYAGWQACIEWYENGGPTNDKVFPKEELAGKSDF